MVDYEKEPDLSSLIRRSRRTASSQYFVVEDATVDRHPYAQLASTPPAHRLTYESVTTTYIARGDRQYPLPDPELVLAGLARRWNTFAPVPIATNTMEALCNQVRIVAYESESATVDLGAGPRGGERGRDRSSLRTGFRGQATDVLPGAASAHEMATFAALAGFAAIAGVGAQTTRGLGNVRIELTSPRASRNSRAHHEPSTGEGTPRNSDEYESVSDGALRATRLGWSQPQEPVL